MRRFVLLLLLGLLPLGYAAECPKQQTSPGREILCYTSTNQVQSLQDSICRCTTLVHQGHDLQDLSTYGIEHFQKSLKALNPVLQFVLSINDKHGSLKTSARVRQEAAARIVRILNEIDGIELNVTAGTKERLVHFVQGLRTEMVRKSKEKRIFLVLPTRPQDLAKQFDLKGLSKYVDLFTIPTHYLMDDDESHKTFHPSRLMGLFDMLNTDSLVDLVTGLGAGKRKIVISMPASAYKFTLENSEENAPRAESREIEPVKISRSELCEAMETGEWIIERDEDLTAPYTFKDDTWIAFEDKISAGIKGKYVLLRNLAGLGIHNVEKDSKTKCGISLTEEIYHSFTENKRKTREAVLTSLQEDMRQTKNSYPSHVKSSEFRIVRVVDTEGHVHANRENLQTEFSCVRQGYYVHPKSCNRFYRCVKFNQGVEHYSVFEFDCPAGLVFDEHTQVCVWPGSIEGSACSGSSEIAPSKGPKFTCPDKPGYYADPQNCRFFYACYDLGEHELTAYEFTCPYGLVFDEKKLICEWPYLVPSCGGGNYERNDYGGQSSGHGGINEHAYGHTTIIGTGHGGSGEYDGSSDGGEYGGEASSGGYDESKHGGQDTGHGRYGDGKYTTVHSENEGGVTHGESSVEGHGDAHTTVHSGHGSGVTHVGSSSKGTYGDGYTTVHPGYTGDVTHHDNRQYDGGHTSIHSGNGESVTGIGVLDGSYKDGHTTVHSGYSGGVMHSGAGNYDSGYTTIHSGNGGGVKHGESSEGDHGDANTMVHSGYDGGVTHRGSSSERTHGDGYTTVHPGYTGDVTHDGSRQYNGGHTTIHSENGGSFTDVGVLEGGYKDSHTTVHSGYGRGVADNGAGNYGSGYTTIHSGNGGGVKYGESSEGHHGDANTMVHSGYGGGVTHRGSSSEGTYGDGYTTVHSGYTGDVTHDGSRQYNGGHTTIHSGNGGGVKYGESSEGHHGGANTMVHSGYGGGITHRGSSSEGTYGDGYTTVHSGYTGDITHDGSRQYNGGHTTIHSENGGSFTHVGGLKGGSEDGHTTVHSGYDRGDGNYHDGHTLSNTAYGSIVKHGETSVASHVDDDATGHREYGGLIAHSESSVGSYDGGNTAINSGYSREGVHDASSGSRYTKLTDGAQRVPAHSANAGYTSHVNGAYTTRPNFGVHDIHTPIIQYGGQTGSATHGIDHSTGAGFSLTYGNARSTNHGNFSTGIGGYTKDAGHPERDSKGSVEPGTGSYNDHSSSYGGSKGDTLERGIYHVNFGSDYSAGDSTGSINSGAAAQGVVGTADSASGTVYTHGDVSGTIIAGTNEQGEIISGINQPGYTRTHLGTPGYVVSSGVKTAYDDYNSKRTYHQGIGEQGVIITGQQAPGAVLTGHSSTETYIVGQNAPGVILDGGVSSGTATSGSSGEQYYTGGSGSPIYNGVAGQESYESGTKISDLPKNPIINVGKDMGYKTNEYHDNGGRGTIRYNNGEISHKYTEDDVKEHHTQYGTLPTFDAKSYETMPGSFTKTGPTKTGITTAQLGGSASYVAGTKPRPFSSTHNIGANAFSSSSSYSDASRETPDNRSYGSSTSLPNLSYSSTKSDYDESGDVDISMINHSSTKSKNGESSSGYFYSKPATQLNNFGVAGSTKAPLEPMRQSIPVYSASPAPFLNVHIYNNPSIVTPALVTAAPAVVNGYTYSKPSKIQYQETMYQAAKLPSAPSGVASTGIYSKPSLNNGQRPFPSLSSTVSPIAFTIEPLESFKTTVFEAAKIPVSVSTVQPVIDTGYKTVVSQKQYPINVNTNSFGYSQNTDYHRTTKFSTKDDNSDINVSLQQPHVRVHGQYETADTVGPALLIESSGYGKSSRPSVTQSVTYERPAVIQEQTKYGSVSSSDYSETNDYSDYKQSGGSFGQRISQGSATSTAIYNTPQVTYSPKIHSVPTSTIAPAIGSTHRQSFAIVTSRPTARVPSGGYSYLRPSVKFPTSTLPSITYTNSNIDEYDSHQMTKNGGSPTNLEIPRKEVEKLITNYDRGSAKFVPSGYDTYMSDRSEETTVNIGRYNSQQSTLPSSSSNGNGQSYVLGKFSSADRSGTTYGRVSSATPSYELHTDSKQYGNRVETSASSGYKSSNVNSDSLGKYGVVPSTTYLPITKSSSAPSGQSYSSFSSTSRRPSYSFTTPAVTTYSGGYGRGSSTSSYKVSSSKSIAKEAERGKVIVKLSDLHPLLLGKLGAECTCKADPFANFRNGNKPLQINSSKGRVDLRNYDDSEIYVDLESSKENGDYVSAEDITNGDDGTKYETPLVVARLDNVTPGTNRAAVKLTRPSSTYLPVSSSTYLPPVSSTKRPPSSTYLPAGIRDNANAASYSNDDHSFSASLVRARGGGFRAGKNLRSSDRASSNGFTDQGTTFDRYGPGGLRGADETLQGNKDCAKPGLFRHPNYCNKFYACHWDEWKKKFTLHVLNCPVHLTFDSGAGACNWPSKGPACQDDNLLI